MLGNSLLTQFDAQAFRQVTLPFISTVDKAQEAVRRINATGEAEGVRPVIFSTLVQEDMREIMLRCQQSGLYSRWVLTEAQDQTYRGRRPTLSVRRAQAMVAKMPPSAGDTATGPPRSS